MSPIDEGKAFEPPPATSDSQKPKAARPVEPPAKTTLVAFTLDAETGQVLTVEAVGPGGYRRELSDDARAGLVSKAAQANLQGLVEQAFEAGIGCVLGADADPEATADPEDEEEADLRRILLKSLIARSAARRLVQREVLGPAILGTLMAQAAAARAAPPGSAAAH
jgi:hypothetical protein